jgi:pimeloyl-ACP methyl ester carboxylesterase
VLELGSGPPGLLLHPAGFFGAVWVSQLARLPGHHLVAPDLPGHGLSGAVDYRSLDLRRKFVVDVTAILDQLEIAQAAVVGNSLGGMYALWLALAAPSRVSRVAIVGIPGIALGTAADLGLALLGVPVLNRLLLRLPSNPKRTRAILTPSLGKPASQAADREIFEIHYLAGRRPEVVLSLTTMMEREFRWKTPRPEWVVQDDELARLAIPTYFLVGDTDAYGGRDVVDEAAQKIPDARVDSISGGHFPYLDQPDECARLLSQFLAGA